MARTPRRLSEAQAQALEDLEDAVRAAGLAAGRVDALAYRAASLGTPWRAIGIALRLSAQGAHVRYGDWQQKALPTPPKRSSRAAATERSMTTSEGDPMQQEQTNPLDRRTTHTEAEAYLVLAQLSFRAAVTRKVPPVLGRIREEYDGGDRLTDERAREIMEWTDRRILQAAERHARGHW